MDNPLFVVAVCGDRGAGKTSVLDRLEHDRFEARPYQPTVGLDVRHPRLQTSRGLVRLQLWEVSGTENAPPEVFAGLHGVIIMYDASEPGMFASVLGWLRALDPFLSPTACRMLFANKVDDPKLAPTWTPPPGLLFTTASALQGDGVAKAFVQLAEAMLVQQRRRSLVLAAAPLPPQQHGA